MFPNVRILIAAVVASVVALSCGFAMFAALRVNHEPLSRLATGAAPLQLAAGNPISSVAMPAPADSFGNRFPANQADSAGASPEAPPRQPDHADSVEPPSAVASTTATAPETGTAEPAQPAPVAQAPAAGPNAKPDEVAVAPNEPPPATSSEPAPVATETAVTEPPAEQAAPAKPAAPTEQASQEPNPDTKPDTATTAAAEPPPPEAPHKAAHRHRLAAKGQRARQARAIAQPARQPTGIGGPFVPPPSRVAAKPQRARQARTIIQPVSQPSAIGGPFVPPTNH
jgi:DNA polymerase-3 subunit gamma/tau